MNKNFCLACLKEFDFDMDSSCPFCGFDNDAPVSSDILKPKIVLNDRYIIGKKIAEDGEGISYIAYDAKDKKGVLIKEYMPTSICIRDGLDLKPKPGCEAKFKFLQSDFLELFTSLMDFKSLTNIRQIYDVFSQNNTVYAVCEYFNYKTLNDILIENAGELDCDYALTLFKPLLETLSIIHSHQIIHRGISPQNIVLTDSGVLKLVGFSICSSKAANSEIQTSIIDGYAAPEQYTTTLPHGEWTDVYGICAVFYKALGGTMPPSAQTRIVNDNLISLSSLNSSVPANISNTIMTGLLYDYKARTNSIRSLISSLYISSATTFSTTTFKTPTDLQTKIIEADKADEEDQDDFENDEKRPTPILLKVLLISVPIVIVLVIVIYFLMFGTTFFGTSKHNSSSSSSKESSSEISENNSQEENSQSSSSATSTQTSTSTSTSSQEPSIDQVVVVDFRSLYYEDILNTNQYTSIFKFSAEYVYSENTTSGKVIEQNISPDSLVDINSSITLTVSKGSQFVSIPSIEELNQTTAAQFESYLNNNGISCRIVFEPNALDIGKIIRLDSAVPGSSVDKEGNVTVVIYASSGQSTFSESNSTENSTTSSVQP